MKDIIGNIFGFLYTLSMGDYIFLVGTFLLLLGFLYMIYLIKKDDKSNLSSFNNEISTIESIKESIENDYKPGSIILTDYEKEQEENAIISYEELLKNKNKVNISYDDEYQTSSEVIVKKININNDYEESEHISNLKVKLMSYEKEEAFLETLKKLQQNLLN